jgi:hypothetical protein
MVCPRQAHLPKSRKRLSLQIAYIMSRRCHHSLINIDELEKSRHSGEPRIGVRGRHRSPESL